MSLKEGKAPVDRFDMNDPINKTFWENSEYKSKIGNTLRASNIIATDYVAIYYAGGMAQCGIFVITTNLQK